MEVNVKIGENKKIAELKISRHQKIHSLSDPQGLFKDLQVSDFYRQKSTLDLLSEEHME